MQQRRHAAIMFTDIVGYTALMGSDEDRAFNILRKNRELHKRLIKPFRGELIKEMGDGMLISFHLSSDAVQCAQLIQIESKKKEISLKIGIHEGEMVFEGSDVLGDGVNIASRLQEATAPGCISISGAVYNNIKNLPRIETEFIKETTFKNVDEPLKVYNVRYEKLKNTKDGNRHAGNLQNHQKPNPTKPLIDKKIKVSTIIIGILILIVTIITYNKLSVNDRLKVARDPDERISIAVMPFKNLTGDSELNVWQEGIQNLLITSLSNSEELAVRQYETMYNLFDGNGEVQYSSITPSIASDIALKLEANTLIVGNIHKSGNIIRITANLLNSKSEEIYRSYEIDGKTEDDFFTISDSLSTLVKNYLEIKILEQDILFDLKNAFTKSAQAYKYYIQGFRYHSKLDYNSAIELYNKAIDIDSNFVSAMLKLSYSYGDIGQTELSKKWVYKAYDRIDNVPYDIQLTIKEVKAAIDKKPYDIIKYTKEYLEINPYSVNKWYGIGWAYYNTEQWQNAIESFEKNLELNKKLDQKTWIWTYILLARAYHHIGEHKKENQLFDKFTGIFPNEESQTIYWQAICSISQGDTARTNIYLLKISDIGEQKKWPQSKVLLWKARVHDLAGNLIEAEQLYRQTLQVDPNNIEVMKDFGYFLISKEINIEEGMELIIRVIDEVPDNGKYLYTYGLGLYKSGNLTKALEVLNRAWDIIPYYDHEHFLTIQEVNNVLTIQNK